MVTDYVAPRGEGYGAIPRAPVADYAPIPGVPAVPEEPGLLRPGQEVMVAALSINSVTVKSQRRMKPTTRTELQLIEQRRILRGEIDRCRVIGLDPLCYEAIFVFDHSVEMQGADLARNCNVMSTAAAHAPHLDELQLAQSAMATQAGSDRRGSAPENALPASLRSETIYWQPADAVAAAAQRTEMVTTSVVPAPSALMPNDFDGNRSRRRYVRVRMPFDGYRVGVLDTPQRISDLSLGGCFVISTHEQRERSRLVLKIDLTQEGTVTLNAETVHTRPSAGFAVRFVDVDADTTARLVRTVETLTQGPAGYW